MVIARLGGGGGILDDSMPAEADGEEVEEGRSRRGTLKLAGVVGNGDGEA